MKKERCMLFFDIDGTLITTDGKRTFPESAKRCLLYTSDAADD